MEARFFTATKLDLKSNPTIFIKKRHQNKEKTALQNFGHPKYQKTFGTI